MPDPMTMITWDGWVEINPETAEKMGIRKGDVVALNAGNAVIHAPAFPYAGIPAGYSRHAYRARSRPGFQPVHPIR